MKRFVLIFCFCVFISGSALAALGDMQKDGPFRTMTVLKDTVYLLDQENQLFTFQAGGEIPEGIGR